MRGSANGEGTRKRRRLRSSRSVRERRRTENRDRVRQPTERESRKQGRECRRNPNPRTEELPSRRHRPSWSIMANSMDRDEPVTLTELVTIPIKPSTTHTEPGTTEEEPDTTQRRRRGPGRSGTQLKEINKDRLQGQRTSIQFDRFWNPVGEHRTKYQSFVSLLARNKPSITIETWDAVEERVKNQIWDTIQLSYDVPDNAALKHKTLSYCADRWRAFKAQLTRYYIYHNKDKDGNPRPSPCAKYPFIDEATWEEFVRIRTSEAALVKRAKAVENSKKNDCPHTMSRGGYEKAERDLLAAKRKRQEEEAQTDPFVILSPPSPIHREDKWLYAHQKRSGSFTFDRARIIAEKISELKQQETEGSFKSDGRNDILTVVTGKKEHGGRVRGVGSTVRIRDYFGPHSRHSQVPKEERVSLLAAVRAEAKAEAMAEAKAVAEALLDTRLQAELAKLKEEMLSMISTSKQPEPRVPDDAHSLVTRHSTKSSNCVAEPMSKDPTELDGDDHYDLFVEDPLKRLVAHGTLHRLGATVHHIQLTEDQVRVAVVEVLDEDALVPIPTAEVKKVIDAKGTFVVWPKHLVSDRSVSLPKRPAPKPFLTALQRVILLAFDNSFHIATGIPMEAAVGENGAKAFLDHTDLKSLIIPGSKLTVASIQVFLRYLQHELVSTGKDSKYGFLCPIQCQIRGTSNELTYIHILKRLRETNVDCLIAPYLVEDSAHWQLVVLCKNSYTVLFLCSLHYKVSMDCQKAMNAAMRTFQIVQGKKHAKAIKDPHWIIPKSRRQPVQSNLCGFYILKHVVNIIRSNRTDFTEQMFDQTEPFLAEDTDELRNLWAQYFVEHILPQH